MGGRTSLQLLLCFGVALSTAVDLQKRAAGGQNCGTNERQYHVKLMAVDGKTSHCGASLVSDQWILTAAHCWEWAMQAVLGVHAGQKETTVLITEKPVVYMDQEKANSDIFHDIMLLKLPKPTKIKPITLSDCKDHLQVGATVQIAGYGAASAPESEDQTAPAESESLHCALTQVSDCKPLKNSVPESPLVKRFQSCGQKQDVSLCKSDAGGGVTHNGVLHGVITTTGDNTNDCSELFGFMDICMYTKWIKKTTSKSIFG